MKSRAVLCAAGAITAVVAVSVVAAPVLAAPARNLTSPALRLHAGSVTVIDTKTDQVAATVKVGKLPGEIVVGPNGTAYVLNSWTGTVSRIRLGLTVTARTISTKAAVGIAITPGRKRIYISRRPSRPPYSPGIVQPVNAATGDAERAIHAPSSGGQLVGPIAVTPNGREVAAAETGGFLPREGLLLVHTSGSLRRRVIKFGYGQHLPFSIAITPDSRTVYVLSYPGYEAKDDLLTPISLATGRALKSLALPFAQGPIVMTPDGRFLYLADYYDNTVTVIRTATNRIIRRIHVNFAWSLGTSPDSKTVYVGGADPVTGEGEVTVISTSTNKASRPILLGQDTTFPNAIAVAPNGQMAYMAENAATGNFVVPMSTKTNSIGTFIPVGPEPSALAFAQKGSVLYVVNSNNES